MTILGATTYRFGPFEVRAASGELLKAGRRVRLQDQPFRLLIVLLEHAGHVVTREEIQRKIWPENTFVDFDSSLRVAVRKLRDALGDDADRPVYVETIPKRGYRFLITDVRRESIDTMFDRRSIAQSAAAPVRPARSSMWTAAIAALAFIAVAAGVYLWQVRRVRPVLTDKDTVVLADFTNTTGDSVFDTTLRQGLLVELEQSPFLSVVSDERIQQTLRLMTRPPTTPLTGEVALAICERTASAAVVDGSIARLGNEYVIGLRAKTCRGGDVLDEEQAQAVRKEDILNALSRIAARLRTRLGESLATVEKFQTPLAEATTASLEALRAYSAGLRALSSGGSASAIPLFKQAVDIDPGFAIAYAWLGRMYGDIGEFELSAESTTKAYELRARATQAEQFFISASYDLQVTGNLEKARLTCESWAQAYPRSFIPHSFLAGIIAPALGGLEHAVDEANKAVDAEPDFWVSYYILAFAQQYLNRFPEAERALDRAAERRIDVPEFLVERYDLAFLRNDRAAMDRAVSLARGNPEAEYAMADHQAFVYAYSGLLRQAGGSVVRAAAIARQSGERERATQFQAGQAVWEGLFGNAGTAREIATAVLAESHSRDVEYGAAVALALAHDASRARTLAADLESRFPEDTGVRFNYVPTIRALAALDDSDPAKALDLLRIASAYELAPTRGSMHAFFGALYPVYVRGLAYLAAHQGRDAAAEFQKILDRRGIVVSDAVGALAQYQLARAYALAGESDKARAAYGVVFALWATADPDVPVVKQARADYAALR